MKKINLPKEFLLKEYIQSHKSASQIGRELNCSTNVILRNLNAFDIKLRNKLIYYCKKCGSKLSRKRKSELCIHCFNKSRIHPMKNKKHTKLSIEKMRITQSKIVKYGTESRAFKHGRCCASYQNYCIDCNRGIDYRSIRCSACQGILNSNLREGKNNPAYVHGRSKEPYPAKWTEKLKESIRIRDNCTCQNLECNYTQEENGQSLHVHHIDYNKPNCREYNLISLCRDCHNKTNFNRSYWFAYYTYIREESVCQTLKNVIAVE